MIVRFENNRWVVTGFEGSFGAEQGFVFAALNVEFDQSDLFEFVVIERTRTDFQCGFNFFRRGFKCRASAVVGHDR